MENRKVGLGLRGFALLFDWYVCGVLANFVVGVVIANAASQSNKVTSSSLLLGLVICVIYLVIVPQFIWKGQTLGQRLMRYKFVKSDGNDVGLKEVLLRQVVGVMLLDSYLTASTSLLIEMLAINEMTAWIANVDKVMFVLSIISLLLVLFSKRHKAIHDLLAKTEVVTIDKK